MQVRQRLEPVPLFWRTVPVKWEAQTEQSSHWLATRKQGREPRASGKACNDEVGWTDSSLVAALDQRAAKLFGERIVAAKIVVIMRIHLDPGIAPIRNQRGQGPRSHAGSRSKQEDLRGAH